MLVEGVTVEYRSRDGAVRGAQVLGIDFENPANNDWLAVNQFTVVENEHERRPDIVLFVNGLPLGLIELKNPADEKATVWTAWQQLQTYKAELQELFAFNAALIASDGVEARIGTLTGEREWFKPWRTIAGEALADPSLPQLQVMLTGVCEPHRFLALVRDFIVFEDDGSGTLVKKMAGYHQFHAVGTAVAETLRATRLQRADVSDKEPGVDQSVRTPGGCFRRPAHWSRLAHPGFGQEPDHGLLCRADHPRAGDGEPDDRRADGSQRPGRPALRHFRALPGPATAAASSGPQPCRPAHQAGGGVGRRGVHHDPEVLSGREGRPAPRVVGAPEHRGHRRRGAPQPIRLHRRLRSPHARCAAQRLVHRLHRHADRAGGRQHAGGVRRLHQRLRYRAIRRGPRNGADLLREPAGEAGTGRGRTAEDRSRLRGGDRGRGGRAQGEAQDQVGSA